ncbi:hypothetical protein GZ77_17790 [Endozoicomonas montiporae]|uniref:Flagellar protein n=2 Tax=Endozoicomonas montiporae TaxID=1027273 RepID=A0A081N1R7_9GAMM|nr:flagellar biosynthetic protein FliO [Endozoicomonas montiporae]AMO58668.1 flagellar biogenesis protein [Endozoicomonas montiporae CL-33]KEQ12390.1 hypothetical protein GZ77_17790 [Endozoicomonas montiporae]
MAIRYYTLLPCLLVTQVFAEEQNPGIEDLSLMQVVMPLLLVIVLIFVLAWLVKKMNPGTPTLGQGITVIASAPVSSQARVCLIRVGDKDILVGVTSHQVTPIHTFEESPVPAAEAENPQDFAHQFKRMLKGSRKEQHKEG